MEINVDVPFEYKLSQKYNMARNEDIIRKPYSEKTLRFSIYRKTNL